MSLCVCMLSMPMSVRRKEQARGAPARALGKLTLLLSVLSPGFDHRWRRRRKEKWAWWWGRGGIATSALIWRLLRISLPETFPFCRQWWTQSLPTPPTPNTREILTAVETCRRRHWSLYELLQKGEDSPEKPKSFGLD